MNNNNNNNNSFIFRTACSSLGCWSLPAALIMIIINQIQLVVIIFTAWKFEVTWTKEHGKKIKERIQIQIGWVLVCLIGTAIVWRHRPLGVLDSEADNFTFWSRTANQNDHCFTSCNWWPKLLLKSYLKRKKYFYFFTVYLLLFT